MNISGLDRKNTIHKSYGLIITMLLMVVINSLSEAYCQDTHSPNTFSPYSTYGLGDCVSSTTASQRAMGGVGVAMRPNTHVGPVGTHIELNYLNPAWLGFIPQRSALFSFGAVARYYSGKGSGYDYNGNLVTAVGRRNSASMNDLGFAVPLSRTLGLSLSLTPTTYVGYRITSVGDEQEIVENIGRSIYTYSGEGGVNEFKASVGCRLLKNLSIGGTFGYYFGNINRYYQSSLSNDLIPGTNYRALDALETYHISEIFFEAGIIYTLRLSRSGYLNFGGTFRTSSNIGAPYSKTLYTTSSTVASDTLTVTSSTANVRIPPKVAGGIFYNDLKFSIGFDYEYQNYENCFDVNTEVSGFSLSTQQQFRFGIAYTPDKYDLYETFKRLTYKFGLKYGTSYLVKDGYHLKDASVTLGVDIPLKRGTLNKATVALECGKRGKYFEGQVREFYIKLNVGFQFFGDDMWFYKRKFY